MFTSVKLNSLEVGLAPYWVGQPGLSSLRSLYKVEPRLAQMAGRHPHLTGWTPVERSVPLVVGFQGASISARATLYTALEAALAPRYIPVEWTVDGNTFTLYAVCSEAVVDEWYKEAAVSLLAPDPVAV